MKPETENFRVKFSCSERTLRVIYDLLFSMETWFALAAFGDSATVVSRRENVTTERAQDPTVHCAFLRKVLLRFFGILAERSLSVEDLDLHFVTLNKVDEVDVFLEDSLYADENLYQAGRSKAKQA